MVCEDNLMTTVLPTLIFGIKFVNLKLAILDCTERHKFQYQLLESLTIVRSFKLNAAKIY